MDFVVLAAGAGTRMGHLGRYLQKCMMPIGLKPFLQHALEQLLASGATHGADHRLALVVGHQQAQIRAYFGDRFEGLPIVYVEQHERLGTGHALSLAAAALQPRASVVAWQGDLLPTRALFARLLAHPAATVVTLGPGQPGESDRLRATRDGDRLTRVWDGADDLFDIGLWKLEPQALARMTEVKAEKGEFRMLPNLQRCIDDGLHVGFIESDDWIHLGGTLPTPELNVRAVTERVWREADALEGARGGQR